MIDKWEVTDINNQKAIICLEDKKAREGVLSLGTTKQDITTLDKY